MNDNKRSFFYGVMLLILAQCLVGINIVACKYLLTSMSPVFLLLVRFSLASILVLPLHWLHKPQQSLSAYFYALSSRDWQHLLAQALTAGVLFNCLMITGLSYTDANVAGIITSALPAIITLMSCCVLKETLTPKKSLCLLFASIGLFIIAYDKLESLSTSHSLMGDAIVVFALLPEAAYYVLSKLHSVNLPIFLLSSVFNAINACVLFLFVLFNHISLPSTIDIHWIILILLGLTSALFFVLFCLGSQRVDGLMASLSTAVMPVATVILAWLILGEQLSYTEALGMGLVMCSIIIYAKR
jgi:drug/metabolite transporter (DMT)-like permease